MSISAVYRILSILLICAIVPVHAEDRATIRIDASHSLGPLKPIWRYFGYDEPNYTYTELGQKLIRELVQLSHDPVYIRTHNLLTSGDARPALKWGSTNAYTEDSSGNPVYDWKVVDRILDTYLHAGTKPFVEVGFMPQALSTHPEPYQHHWPAGDLYLGWTYPPKDYQKWGALVYEWVKHCLDRYGRSEVTSWYWEVWNEPNIGYWHGTPDEYNRLYDFTAASIKRALPEARVGGPASTGPANEKAASFLRQFLRHCDDGQNAATGTKGSPLDFITYHAKGRPELSGERLQMGLAQNMRDVSAGFDIISGFPKFRDSPIILTESDPEGCAACSARTYPQNAYRNGPLYTVYVAEAMNTIIELASQRHVNLDGMLTWAFEFEDQPYFDGFRTLATNGIDKPVLNVFRMAGLMRGNRLQTISDAALGTESILKNGVRDRPDINALSALADRSLTIMAWNYHDNDAPAAPAPVTLLITGLPKAATRVLLHHYRVDQEHSNSYTAWKAMGSPQAPGSEQHAKLESAGQLQLLESPSWSDVSGGHLGIKFLLPRHAVSLLELSW
jgi:xylan 1,4-beta-xylosidase